MDGLAAARTTPWGRLHGALMPDYNRKATAYWWTMVCIGALVLAYCAGEVARLPRDALLQIVAGAAIATLAGFFPVRIPRSTNSFAAGEIFIFLVLLLHGAPAASLAAAGEALVGYVVPRGAMPVDAALREHARASLPEYMVPQSFVRIDAVPLTPSGKVDRKALPEPPAVASRDDGAVSSAAAAATDAERGMIEIWRRLLGVERIGTGDNFFDLGGHSLLAMRVVTEARERLGLRIDVRRLVFETLGQLAATAPGGPAPEPVHAGADAEPVPVRPVSRIGRWFGRR